MTSGSIPGWGTRKLISKQLIGLDLGAQVTISALFRKNNIRLAIIIVRLPDEGPSLKTSKFFLYFSGSCIPINRQLSSYRRYLHWHRQFEIIVVIYAPGWIYNRVCSRSPGQRGCRRQWRRKHLKVGSSRLRGALFD